ncbi:DUF2927 domain-containing protein [Pedobacter boryungensis]|uniref:DUF2927 domain-containing protein n=1 Tax=Pedobacter boryungensis TaxID=869962 RepID=A0ABX2DFV0_9SPHI|nr:DUF2927 domain-containing protein [Pedobacter boryungensis]NQX32907.1 DUF2927 domain-containing protein [Pedobacter boryungensis]
MKISKTTLILFLIIISSINSFAQKLTENEKAIFDEVVYKRKKIGEYETLSKWAKPIRYKIYGDTSDYIVKEVDSFFNLLKKITPLDIKKANNESEENLMLVFGEKPADFQAYTSTNRPLEAVGSYRIRTTNSGEIYWAQSLVNTKKFGTRANVKNAIKKNIVKCIGFSGNSELAPGSVFTIKNNNYIKIEDFDIHIISALYFPAIKAGMTRDQVDEILK